MNSLLTIGQLSKLSGIHVKALRYYESINILKPTIVNTE
ncbi:TPA: MerR family DNA-binding transcriptional regulator, partial [Streptococcus suis]|nr:MerR family DNA-binding transcriptional regulator [Streptococcus suis]